MKKSFLKFSSTFLLLTTIGMTGTNAANVWGAEEGTKVIVEDTKMDTIGKRTAIFEGPKGLPCTSTMLTSNFGITAAHCGNGFQEGSVGTVYLLNQDYQHLLDQCLYLYLILITTKISPLYMVKIAGKVRTIFIIKEISHKLK